MVKSSTVQYLTHYLAGERLAKQHYQGGFWVDMKLLNNNTVHLYGTVEHVCHIGTTYGIVQVAMLQHTMLEDVQIIQLCHQNHKSPPEARKFPPELNSYLES